MKVWTPESIKLQDTIKLIPTLKTYSPGRLYLFIYLVCAIGLANNVGFHIPAIIITISIVDLFRRILSKVGEIGWRLTFRAIITLLIVSFKTVKLGKSAYKAIRDYEPPEKPRRFDLDFKPMVLNVKEPEHRPDSAQTFHQLGDTKESDDDGEGGEPCKSSDQTHQQRQKLSWKELLDQLRDLRAEYKSLKEGKS